MRVDDGQRWCGRAHLARETFLAIKRVQSPPGQLAESVTLTLGARPARREPINRRLPYLKSSVYLFSTSGDVVSSVINSRFVMTKERAMKALALLTAAALTLFSVAASAQTYVGKGKAPPPPVVTKG